MDEDFISRHRFAIFDESDRGITLTVFTRAAVIAALLLAAACGSEPEVLEPDPTSSTPSSAVSPPPRPAQATELSDEGASSFVNFWISTSDYAALSGDVQPLREISDPDCSGCNRFIELYEETYERGGQFTGGERTVVGPLQVAQLDDTTFDVTVETRSAAGTVRTSADAETRPTPSESSSVTYTASFENDQWRMLFIVLEQS